MPRNNVLMDKPRIRRADPEWTPESLKKRLPNIAVILNGQQHRASLSGTNNIEATVSVVTDGQNPIHRYWYIHWDDIAFALNMKTTLRLG